MANWRTIRKKIKESPKTIKLAKKAAKKVFEEEKASFIEEFMSHPVSEEILSGPNASNKSGTLNGYGNLFTFIGFSDHSTNPVVLVEKILKQLIRLKRVNLNKGHKDAIEITISTPTLEDFRLSAPMPWEGGSWVIGIERGISGFGSYMYERTSESRSGGAFQAKTPPGYKKVQKIRPGAFRNVKYMSEMIRNFHKKLKRRE